MSVSASPCPPSRVLQFVIFSPITFKYLLFFFFCGSISLSVDTLKANCLYDFTEINYYLFDTNRMFFLYNVATDNLIQIVTLLHEIQNDTAHNETLLAYLTHNSICHDFFYVIFLLGYVKQQFSDCCLEMIKAKRYERKKTMNVSMKKRRSIETDE